MIGQVYETSGVFDWQACLHKIEHETDELWFIQTLPSVIAERHSSFWLILALGEFAYRNGYIDAAKTISSNLLGIKESSWSPFHDGGRRLHAFAFAIKVEGVSARKVAWLDFSSQFKRTSSVELLRELDEVIPVLAPLADIRTIWGEIETYLSRMFAHVEASNDVPDMSAIPSGNGPESLIAKLAIGLSVLAERGLRETAVVHLAKQTATGNIGYVAEVRRFANNTNVDIDQEIFAKIALHLGEVAPTLLAEFLDELRQLSDSTLFSSQVAACTLLQQINMPVQPRPSIQRSLVWLNTSSGIISQERELRRFNEAISEGWTGNRFSKEHLRILLTHRLGIIEGITGFDSDILFQRTVTLLTNELRQGTGRLQKLVIGGEIGLEGTYYPYAVIVPFLVDRLLNELWEGGYLPDLNEVAWLNPLFDPHSFRFEQHCRPEELPGVRGFDDYYTLPSDWVEQIENGFAHFIKQLGDRIVIAERAIFRGLSWGLATEMRESCLTIDSGKASYEFPTGAFHRKVDLLVADYIDMSQSQTTPVRSAPLIIANHAERFLDMPTHLSEWVAINPIVACSLGWQLADPLKFQWVDANSSIVIESYFWVDGNVRMKPPQLMSQAGCGWIVTASQEAFDVLKSRFKLIQKFQLDRQTQDSSSRKVTHRTLRRVEAITY